MKQQSQSNGHWGVLPAPSLFIKVDLNTRCPPSSRLPVNPSPLNTPPSPSDAHFFLDSLLEPFSASRSARVYLREDNFLARSCRADGATASGLRLEPPPLPVAAPAEADPRSTSSSSSSSILTRFLRLRSCLACSFASCICCFISLADSFFSANSESISSRPRDFFFAEHCFVAALAALLSFDNLPMVAASNPSPSVVYIFLYGLASHFVRSLDLLARWPLQLATT